MTLRNALKNVHVFSDCHEYREGRENKGARIRERIALGKVVIISEEMKCF